MSSRNALDALQQQPLAVAIRESAWAFPLLEIVHIAAFAAMIGTVLTVEMRVLGLQQTVPLRELGRLGIKIALAAINMVVFHLRGSLAQPDGLARAQAVLSLLLWLGVISAGRLIAYV
jgi:hypothetical protein